jgi:hypothetical protein
MVPLLKTNRFGVDYLADYIPRNTSITDSISEYLLKFKGNLQPNVRVWIELSKEVFLGKRFDYIVRILSHNETATSNNSPLDRLGEALAQVTNAKYIPFSLKKNRSTVPLKTLSRNARIQALQGSYFFESTGLKPDATFLIIDDITTTGVSFAFAYKAIKQSLPQSNISMFALSQTGYDPAANADILPIFENLLADPNYISNQRLKEEQRLREQSVLEETTRKQEIAQQEVLQKRKSSAKRSRQTEADINRKAQEEKTQFTATYSPVLNHPQEPIQQKASKAPYEYIIEDVARKKDEHSSNLSGIVLILIILIIVGGTIYYFWTPSSPKNDSVSADIQTNTSTLMPNKATQIKNQINIPPIQFNTSGYEGNQPAQPIGDSIDPSGISSSDPLSDSRSSQTSGVVADPPQMKLLSQLSFTFPTNGAIFSIYQYGVFIGNGNELFAFPPNETNILTIKADGWDTKTIRVYLNKPNTKYVLKVDMTSRLCKVSFRFPTTEDTFEVYKNGVLLGNSKESIYLSPLEIHHLTFKAEGWRDISRLVGFKISGQDYYVSLKPERVQSRFRVSLISESGEIITNGNLSINNDNPVRVTFPFESSDLDVTGSIYFAVSSDNYYPKAQSIILTDKQTTDINIVLTRKTVFRNIFKLFRNNSD